MEQEFLNSEFTEVLTKKGSLPLHTPDFIESLYKTYPERFLSEFDDLEQFKEYQAIRKFVRDLKIKLDKEIKENGIWGQ